MQPLCAFSHGGVLVRKGVDLAMQQNSLLNPFGKMCILISPNTIGYKISYGNFIILKRQINMR
jgi:hypothetical protein